MPLRHTNKPLTRSAHKSPRHSTLVSHIRRNTIYHNHYVTQPSSISPTQHIHSNTTLPYSTSSHLRKTCTLPSKSHTNPSITPVDTQNNHQHYNEHHWREIQTLSDLFMFHLFPNNNRSVDQLISLHEEFRDKLFSTMQTNPLAPQSLAAYSLLQLHHINYKLKTLSQVVGNCQRDDISTFNLDHMTPQDRQLYETQQKSLARTNNLKKNRGTSEVFNGILAFFKTKSTSQLNTTTSSSTIKYENIKDVSPLLKNYNTLKIPMQSLLDEVSFDEIFRESLLDTIRTATAQTNNKLHPPQQPLSIEFNIKELYLLFDHFIIHILPTLFHHIIENIDDVYYKKQLSTVLTFQTEYLNTILSLPEYHVDQAQFVNNTSHTENNNQKKTRASNKKTQINLYDVVNSINYIYNNTNTPQFKPYHQFETHSNNRLDHYMQHQFAQNIKPLPTIDSTRKLMTSNNTKFAHNTHTTDEDNNDYYEYMKQLKPDLNISIINEPGSNRVASLSASYTILKSKSHASNTTNESLHGPHTDIHETFQFYPTLISDTSNTNILSNHTTRIAPSEKEKGQINSKQLAVQSLTKKHKGAKTMSFNTKKVAITSKVKQKTAKQRMSRNRQGFVEYAILPPSIGVHHSILTNERTSIFSKYNTPKTTDIPADIPSKPHSFSHQYSDLTTYKLPYDDIYAASLQSPSKLLSLTPKEHEKYLDMRNSHNLTYFQHYPAKSTFSLTFQTRSIQCLLNTRQLLSPSYVAHGEELLSRPFFEAHPKNTNVGEFTYQDLIMSFSQKHYHSHHQRTQTQNVMNKKARKKATATPSILDINIIDCPALLFKLNKFLDYILSTVDQPYLDRAQSELDELLLWNELPSSAARSVPKAQESSKYSEKLQDKINYEYDLLHQAYTNSIYHYTDPSTLLSSSRRLHKQHISTTSSSSEISSSDDDCNATSNTNVSQHITLQFPPIQNTRLLSQISTSRLLHVQGLPLLSGLFGITSILQHELLHAAIFVSAPHLWTSINEKPLLLRKETINKQKSIDSFKFSVNDKELLDTLHCRFSFASDVLSKQQSSHKSHKNPQYYIGNNLPSLLKSGMTSTLLPKQHFIKKKDIPNNYLSSLFKDEAIPDSNTVFDFNHHHNNQSYELNDHLNKYFKLRTPKTSISTLQDGHSYAFKLLSRNLFGQNKINVAIDVTGNFNNM